MGVIFLGSYLCISILEFKLKMMKKIKNTQNNLCISILEFKFLC